MKLILISFLFASPALAQTQTIVDVVDVTGSSSSSGVSIRDRFSAPNVPGEVVGVALDLNLDYFINSTISNPSIPLSLDCLLNWNRLIAYAGTVPTYVDMSPASTVASVTVVCPTPISMGQSVTVVDTWSQTWSTQWDWPLHADESVSIGDGPAHFSQGTPPQGWGFWLNFWFNILPSTGSDTFQVTGTLTWQWEPYLTGVTQVCAGDGIMDLQLVGEWGREVRAVSNHIDKFSLLFRGNFFQHPGTRLCIGSGQRITQSMSSGSMDYIMEPSTLVAGQSFVLQAAHRYATGQVRISNALLVTPQ